MARAAFGVRDVQGQSRQPSAGGFRRISRRARAAAVAVRLFRGAAAQIQQAVVGMAGAMAAARRGQMRRPAPGTRCGRDRIRRIRAMDGRPAVAGLPGSRAPARHEGRSLSRCRRRRAIRRVRCLERAGRDFAPSRRRRAAGSAEYRRPELGPRRLQRRRPRNQVLRAVSGRCCGPRCAMPARSGSIMCWA